MAKMRAVQAARASALELVERDVPGRFRLRSVSAPLPVQFPTSRIHGPGLDNTLGKMSRR
jgi:hypothetical protein